MCGPIAISQNRLSSGSVITARNIGPSR
jgi:hypothetical protein